MDSNKTLLVYKTNLIDPCLVWSTWTNFWFPFYDFTSKNVYWFKKFLWFQELWPRFLHVDKLLITSELKSIYISFLNLDTTSHTIDRICTEWKIFIHYIWRDAHFNFYLVEGVKRDLQSLYPICSALSCIWLILLFKLLLWQFQTKG